MEPTISSDAYALLEVVHDFGSSGTGADTAAVDLGAGPPWFGLQRHAEELEAAGLIEIQRDLEEVPVSDDSAPAPRVPFLEITDAGRALVAARRHDQG